MNKRKSILNRAGSVLLAAGLAAALASPAAAQTEFTYQGVLSDGSGPVTGTENIRFRLYDAPVGGTLFGETTQNVDVADGVFTAPLNLGTLHTIDPASAWLEIAVSTGGGSFDTLGRQKITAAPFAMNTRGIEVAPNNVVSMSPHLRIDGTLEVFPLAYGGSFKVVDFAPGGGIAEGTALLGVYNGESEGPQLRFESDDPDYIFWDIGQNAEKDFAVELFDLPVMTLSQEYRVGIGTANPNRDLHIRSTAPFGDSFLVERFGSVSYMSLKAFPNTQFATPHAEWLLGARASAGSAQGQFIIDVPGGDPAPKIVVDGTTNNVGFNTPLGATPEARLDVSSIGSGTQDVMAFAPANIPQFLLKSQMDGLGGSTDLMYFSRGDGFPILSWNEFGNIGINGILGPAAAVEVNGEVCASAFICESSRKLKNDIAPIEAALSLVDQLEGVTYTWNELAKEDLRGKPAIGFIAEDVAEILPTIVTIDGEGNTIGIDYAKMTPVAIQAIKELKAKHGDEITELRADNDELRVRLERLELMLDTYARNTD